MKQYDYFTGCVEDNNPETDVDEYIICSLPCPGRTSVGHSTHNNIRDAKIAQIKLFTEENVMAWIEHIPAQGPPGIEAQLEAARRT